MTTQSLLADFNQEQTLVIISSFPQLGGEVAADNAVARYTDLLVRHFPTHQRVIVISEQRSSESPEEAYLLTDSILVVPTFTMNSPRLNWQINQVINQLDATRQVLIQLELSIFGQPLVTFGIPGLAAWLRSQGKTVSVMLHQVVTNVADLGGHIQASTASQTVLNTGLKTFYRLLGKSVDQLLVHDATLKKQLASLVGQANIKVIPHGIAPSEALTKRERQTARAQYGFTAQDRVILAYGYQSLYKGTDWIAEKVVELAQAQPDANWKLLLAGGESPTQGHRPEYQTFLKKLKSLIKKNGTIITALGFVPEDEVRSVFAASDIVVFPYRGRMSASGALSLTWQYGKPFLVSTPAAANLKPTDVRTALKKAKLTAEAITFDLHSAATNANSFKQRLTALAQTELAKFAHFGELITDQRSWSNVVAQYQRACGLVGRAPKTTLESKSKSEKLSSLSVFFPMHNEEANVMRVIAEAERVLPSVARKYEIIIVNDGSQDATSSLAHLAAERNKRIVVIDQPNKGYGGALQTGFAAARYDWVFFSDGDLQFDLSELSLLTAEVTQGQNLAVLGYRKQRADSQKRILLAKMLKIWNYIWFQFPSTIKDIDCAFKLFHRSVVKDIFPLKSQGAILSTELLLNLVDKNYPYTQVGVTHLPRQAGQQTGAQWHVVWGAVKETFALFKARNIEPIPAALTKKWEQLSLASRSLS